MKYTCEICGRESNHKNKINGKIVCCKHYMQFKRHGKFLDNNPRSTKDLNNYIIKDDIVIFNLYNKENIKISEFIIDLEDLDLIKYRKWNLSKYGYVVSNNKGNPIKLHRYILNVPEDKVVDHINNNPLDNRHCNLRICTKGQNNCNKIKSGRNTTGIFGVNWSNERKKWCSEIRKNNKRVHLGRWDDKNEAHLARLYAEQLVFKEFQNKTHDINNVLQQVEKDRQEFIYKYVLDKVKDLLV